MRAAHASNKQARSRVRSGPVRLMQSSALAGPAVAWQVECVARSSAGGSQAPSSAVVRHAGELFPCHLCPHNKLISPALLDRREMSLPPAARAVGTEDPRSLAAQAALAATKAAEASAENADEELSR